jgi:hypothetical protein
MKTRTKNKSYKEFLDDLINTDENNGDVITDDELFSIDELDNIDNLPESLSSVVSGVSLALVVKNKSFLSKLKSQNDVNDKLDTLGKMIIINTYGCLASASASVKNMGTLNKMKSFSKRK